MIDPVRSFQTDSPKSSLPQTQGSGGIGGKELETAPEIQGEVSTLKEVGHDAPLPPEVVRVGISQKPTVVQLPPNVAQMGVTAVGQATPPPVVSVTLPLTDDQIARGLTQSITNSWRWLAEWCRRRLKQVHVGLKTMHGKITRVRA